MHWPTLCSACLLVALVCANGERSFSDNELAAIIREAPVELPSSVARALQSETEVNLRHRVADSLFDGDINTPALNNDNVDSFIRGEVISSGPRVVQSGRHYTATTARFRLWEAAIVPYSISNEFSTDEVYVIYNAIKEVERRSCVRFTTAGPTETDFVHFKRGDGCWSSVGRQGGRQSVSLGDGCVRKGIVMHELLHVLGFFHEQSRHDRDNHVDVLWQNILPASFIQFHKFGNAREADSFGAPYDYDSITHYHSHAFSKNDEPTIVPRTAGMTIGQRDHLSKYDTLKINKLYGCQYVLSEAAEASSRDGGGRKPSVLDMFANLGKSSENDKSSGTDIDEDKNRKWTRSPTPMMTMPTTTEEEAELTLADCEDQLSNCAMLVKQRRVCEDRQLKMYCAGTCHMCPQPLLEQLQSRLADNGKLLYRGTDRTTSTTTMTTALHRRVPKGASNERSESAGCRDRPVGSVDVDCAAAAKRGACSVSPSSMTGKYMRALCSRTCKFC